MKRAIAIGILLGMMGCGDNDQPAATPSCVPSAGGFSASDPTTGWTCIAVQGWKQQPCTCSGPGSAPDTAVTDALCMEAAACL